MLNQTDGASKKSRLEALGYRAGTAAEFLGLTPEESEAVESRVKLMRLANDYVASKVQQPDAVVNVPYDGYPFGETVAAFFPGSLADAWVAGYLAAMEKKS